MNCTNDISNLFSRFGASADNYHEFDSYFEYKEKPLTLVPTTSVSVVIDAPPTAIEVVEAAPIDRTIHGEAELPPANISQVAAPLRHLLAEVALARPAEAQARNGEALCRALPNGRPSKTKAHVIALISGMGGVGKSTLASALTTLLRVEHGQTMAIDLDPQNALQHHLGAEPDVAGMGNASLQGENWNSLLLAPPAGSLLLPYGAAIEDERRTLERYLENDRFWLARQLASMDLGENDVLILDTPPGRTAYLDQALMVADQVLVVVTADAACFLALDPMERLLYERKARGQAPLCNYVINQFDTSRAFCRDMQELLKRRLGDHLLGTVALDHSISEALASGQNPLLDSDLSPACRDLRVLSDTLKTQLKSMDIAESYAS